MPDEATLAALHRVLGEHRGNLVKELVAMGADPDSEDVEIDFERGHADSAHTVAERARLIAVTTALRTNLRLVDRALRKVELGTYGVCEGCGKEIAAERLDALPWAILCITCKQKGLREAEG